MALSLFILLATTALSAKAKSDESKQRKIEFEIQADQEKTAAEGRELTRRQNLNRVLAQNVVNLASAGIKGEGTPESIALSSAKQASLSEGVISLSDRLRQSQLERQAANVSGSGKLAAASTLLKGASNIAQTG